MISSQGTNGINMYLGSVEVVNEEKKQYLLGPKIYTIMLENNQNKFLDYH